MNQAMIEVTLVDVSPAVKNLFNELRGAYISCTYKLSLNAEHPGSFSWKEITEDRDTVKAKVEELTIAMQRQLRELEA